MGPSEGHIQLVVPGMWCASVCVCVCVCVCVRVCVCVLCLPGRCLTLEGD